MPSFRTNTHPHRGFDPSVASARSGDSGVTSIASTNGSPLPSAGACHAVAQRNSVLKNVVVGIGQDGYSYFGDLPNPDSTNPTPRPPPVSNQKRWIKLFANNSKCNRVWSKTKKVKCFVQVLHLPECFRTFYAERGNH